jgi:tetratricopeptide (TPR) repeat protein
MSAPGAPTPRDARGGAPRWLRSAIGASLVAIIVIAPLAIGSAHTTTRLLLAFAASAVLAATLVERVVTGKRLPIVVPTVALACAVVFTLLQLVPLPPDLLAGLAPITFETLDNTREGWGWHAVSLDPAHSLHELVKVGAYLAVFVAALTYASRRHRKRLLVMAVVGAATLVTLIGFVQAAFGQSSIMYFYRPHDQFATLVRGTFVNPNHFGALLCTAVPCALAVGIREPRWRWFALPVTVALNVAIVLSLARASVIAAVVGQIVTFALDRWQLKRGSEWSRDGRHAWRALAVGAAVAVVATAVIGMHVLEPVWDRSISAELKHPYSKYQAWSDAARLIWEQPWTGIGRGAFEQAFTRVSDVGGQVRFPWAENGYVQAATDWGVPATLLLCLLAGWSLVVAVRRMGEDPLAVGALGGIIALAVHETVDFSVELPGVALPALAILATLYSRRQSESELGRRRLHVHWTFFAIPAALVAAAIVAWRVPTAQADVDSLTRAARDPATSIEAIVRLGEGRRARHPAEYRIPALVAERLARERDSRALRWLNDAIYLNPTHPTLHLMAAEILAVAGRKSQALLEYRTAAQHAANPRLAIWPAAARRYPAMADLETTCPTDVDSQRIFAKWLDSLGRVDDAERMYLRIVETHPQHTVALQWLVRRALDRGDRELAADRVEALLTADHGRPSRLLAIRARQLAGDLDGAARALDAEAEQLKDVFDAEIGLAMAYAEAGKTAEARARLEDLGRTWSLTPDLRMVLHDTRAEIERNVGNLHQYRWELEQRDRLKKEQF